MAGSLMFETESYEPCNTRPPYCECDCVQALSRPQPNLKAKPKKSFWQQLFGEKKCCLCLKKKQYCSCVGKQKKQKYGRCVCIDYQRADCEPRSTLCPPQSPQSYLSQPYPLQQSPPQPYKPCRCKSNPYSYPRKGCLPTQNSICGCHFYMNCENRPRYCIPRRIFGINGKRKQSYTASDEKRQSYTASDEKRQIHTASDEKMQSYKASDEKMQSYKASDEKKNLSTSRPTGEVIKLQDPDETKRKATRPSENDIHVGLTFTREETKYFRPEDSPCMDAEKNRESRSSDKTLTLEIKTSGNELNKDEHEQNVSLLEEQFKHRKRPSSESWAREVRPLLMKKYPRSSGISLAPIVEENKRKPSTLDRSVSEILKKLNSIEKKIEFIDRKEKEAKDITIDFDGQKSTLSVHFKDQDSSGSNEKRFNDNRHKAAAINTNAVIKIRHSKSTIQSPVKKHSYSQFNELHNSQSLHEYKVNKKPNQRIIIKLPTSGSDNYPTSPNIENPRQNVNRKSSMWYTVSDELKLSPDTKCYCYDCLCKRNRCL